MSSVWLAGTQGLESSDAFSEMEAENLTGNVEAEARTKASLLAGTGHSEPQHTETEKKMSLTTHHLHLPSRI